MDKQEQQNEATRVTPSHTENYFAAHNLFSFKNVCLEQAGFSRRSVLSRSTIESARPISEE